MVPTILSKFRLRSSHDSIDSWAALWLWGKYCALVQFLISCPLNRFLWNQNLPKNMDDCTLSGGLGFVDMWDSNVSPCLNQLHQLMLSKLIYLWNPVRNSEFMALILIFQVKCSWTLLTRLSPLENLPVSSGLLLELLQAPIPSLAEQYDTNWWSGARDKSQPKPPSCVFPLLCFSRKYFTKLTKWFLVVTPTKESVNSSNGLFGCFCVSLNMNGVASWSYALGHDYYYYTVSLNVFFWLLHHWLPHSLILSCSCRFSLQNKGSGGRYSLLLFTKSVKTWTIS